MNTKKVGQLTLWILGCNLAGALGSFFTASSVQTWYLTLEKPVFNPPSWLFAPVWVTLYTLMGIAAFLIMQKGWKRQQVRKAMSIFGVQLFLNAIWTPIFFGAHRIDIALAVIMLLFVAIIWTMVLFYRESKPAAYLLAPYLLWVGFASALNAAILLLN